MYVGKLLRIITIYEILDKGCSKHRGYRAKRKPRVADCTVCNALWVLRQELKELLEDTGMEQ
jgi:hypothetical protein